MADFAYKNSNGETVGANFYRNDEGVIKRFDDVFYNIGGVFKFPQLQSCVLNLDALTWIRGNEVYNASTWLDPNTNRLKIYDFQQESNFGTIKDNQIDVGSSQNFFINRSNRFLARGNNKGDNKISLLDKSFVGDSRSFTISISFYIVNFVNNWVRMIQLEGDDNTRIESPASRTNFVFASSRIASNIDFSFTSSQANRYVNISIVCDNENGLFRIYKNGDIAGETNIVGTIQPPENSRSISFFTGYDTATKTNCTNAKLRSLRAWTSALSQEEILNLMKIDGIQSSLSE